MLVGAIQETEELQQDSLVKEELQQSNQTIHIHLPTDYLGILKEEIRG